MYYMYIGYLNIPMSFKIIYLRGCFLLHLMWYSISHKEKALGVLFKPHAKGRKRTNVSA